MSKESATKTNPDTSDETPATTENPGLRRRIFDGISRTENSISNNNPIFAEALGVAAGVGMVAAARPVGRAVARGVEAVRERLFDKGSEEVTREAAQEGSRAFSGGGGGVIGVVRRLFG